MPVNIISTELTNCVGYLIGVPRKFLSEDQYLALGRVKENRTFRALSKIRSQSFMNYSFMTAAFKNNSTYASILQTMRAADQLEKEGIVLRNEGSLIDNLIGICSMQEDIVNDVLFSLPYYIDAPTKRAIKKILLIPDGTTEEGIKSAYAAYETNIKEYPYGVYLNWDFSVGDLHGNILRNEDEFLTEIRRRMTPSENEQSFLASAKDLVVVIDSENSDPEKVYEMLNRAPKGKIAKVILVDDINASPMWHEVAALLKTEGYPVVTDNTMRLNYHKSLVDFKMITHTCEEYYKEGHQSFILCTSDSDIWALIEALPAKFVVAAEKEKCGNCLIDKLAAEKVPCWWLDSYQSDGTIRAKTVRLLADSMLARYTVPMSDLIKEIFDELHLTPTKEEIEELSAALINNVSVIKDCDGGLISLTVNPSALDAASCPKKTTEEEVCGSEDTGTDETLDPTTAQLIDALFNGEDETSSVDSETDVANEEEEEEEVDTEESDESDEDFVLSCPEPPKVVHNVRKGVKAKKPKGKGKGKGKGKKKH